MDNELYKIFEKTYFNHKYYLKKFKGAGAFGAVFLADEVVGGTKIQEVAIKAIRKDKMPSDIIAKELVTAIRLKHPNLINCITSEEGRLKHSVFDYDCFGLVMEIASGTLEDYLQASRVLPISEVRDIVEAIASGLVYLHGQSVTHRDLKPANVLRVGNVWKISDFGIARQMGRESGTMTTSLTGTPIYMPPEVYAAYSEASPMKVSPAWDIWSLGVMIVEMLTGELPFEEVTNIWKIKIKVKGDLPAPFDAIVQNCMIEDPNLRLTASQIREKIVETKFDNPKDYFDRAERKRKNEDYQGAITDYSEAIHLDDHYATAYHGRGFVKFKLGDKQGAIADYCKAIYLDLNYAEAYQSRGWVKQQLGNKQGAIDDYNEAIRLKPNYSLVYGRRGSTKSELGDYQGAINDYNTAIKINCNWGKGGIANAYAARAYTKQASGDNQGAIDDYSEAIKIDLNYHDAYLNRGAAKEDLGDDDGAMSDYSEAIRLNPECADSYLYRGTIRKERNDKKGALVDFYKAAGLYQQQGNRGKHRDALNMIQELEKIGGIKRFFNELLS